MKFQVDQKVRVKLHGQEVKGQVLEKPEFGQEPLWWVKVNDMANLFSEESLEMWNSPCICGAEKTYAPNEPPGHGYYCRSKI